MENQRRGSHTVSRLICYIDWVTKYGYKILKGDIQKYFRGLSIQGCESVSVE